MLMPCLLTAKQEKRSSLWRHGWGWHIHSLALIMNVINKVCSVLCQSGLLTAYVLMDTKRWYHNYSFNGIILFYFLGSGQMWSLWVGSFDHYVHACESELIYAHCSKLFSYPLPVCIQLKNSGMYEILVQLAEESVLQLFVCSLFYMKMKLKY